MDQVLRDAWKNTIEKYPARQFSVSDFLLAMGDIEKIDENQEAETMLWAVTNNCGCYGASAIFYPGAIKKLEEKFGNFYILPASCHEVLILPEFSKENVKNLEKLVQDINRTQVRPKEWLSDRVYHYDAKEKKLEFAVDYEYRMKKAEREVTLAIPAKKREGPTL